MNGVYLLPGGLECELLAAPLPGVRNYHVLAATGTGFGDDFEQIALLATHIASELGLALFDDRAAFAVILNGSRTARHPWPHAHIIPVRSVRERRRALVCLFFKGPLRRLRGRGPQTRPHRRHAAVSRGSV